MSSRIRTATRTNTAADPEDALQNALAPWFTAIEAMIERAIARVLAEQETAANRHRLLTDRELAAEVLGCSVDTLQKRLIHEGLPFVPVGDMRRYDVAEVLAWLKTRRG